MSAEIQEFKWFSKSMPTSTLKDKHFDYKKKNGTKI